MKKILGLDIGVNSVGYAIVFDDDNKKTIEKLGVRIVPRDEKFHGNFYHGNPASKNAERRSKRAIRRNYQRLKLRKDNLNKTLLEYGLYPGEDLLKLNTLDLFGLRAKSVNERVELKELGRILIHLNQKRGFLSNRKADNQDEKELSKYKQSIKDNEEGLGGRTIGQAHYDELKSLSNPNEVSLRGRTYNRVTHLSEFNRIWNKQKEYHGELTDSLLKKIRDQIIYYQRPLRSQKSLIRDCQFEKYCKGVNKSSPFFEMFRILQNINDLEFKNEFGQKIKPTQEIRNKLFKRLFFAIDLNSNCELSTTEIKKEAGYGIRERIYPNIPKLQGCKTIFNFKKVFDGLGIKSEEYFQFNYFNPDNFGNLYDLWHITYSIESSEAVVNTLIKRFSFTEEQAKKLENKIKYPSTYSNLSTKAIRKLLAYMVHGLSYYEACEQVGYDFTGLKTEIKVKERIELIPKNKLRNPVVEQILNQTINTVNTAIERYGQFDEIRVELARELKNSAKVRKSISKANDSNKKRNIEIRKRLQEDYNMNLVNGRDLKRYVLWEETSKICLYCNQPITVSQFLNGDGELEHILPKSRSFNNSMNNFILAHRTCNQDKGQRTAFDFMKIKGEDAFNGYVEMINDLYDDGGKNKKISKQKRDNLLCSGDDIPNDFVSRMLKDTQYISKEAVKVLRSVCPKVVTTTGQITEFLRDEWGLNRVLEEVVMPKYQKAGLIEKKEIKSGDSTKTINKIVNWSKRDDHRHHSVDALIIALTDAKIIYKLNNLNKIYQYEKGNMTPEERQMIKESLEENFNIKHYADSVGIAIPMPMENLRAETKNKLEQILISFKKEKSKAVSKSINRYKSGKGKIDIKPSLSARGALHKDTVYRVGKSKKIVPFNEKFNQINLIVDDGLKTHLQEYLNNNGNKPEIVFSKEAISKNPIIWKNKTLTDIEIWNDFVTKRKEINENLSLPEIRKIADKRIKELVKERLAEFKDNPKKAFKGLKENPIYFNSEKQIPIKRVRVEDGSELIPIRTIKVNENIEKPNDYVKSGNNHHALVYLGENEKVSVKVVNFLEAVSIGTNLYNSNGSLMSVIDRNDCFERGRFLFSLQINDLFVYGLKHSQNPEADNELDFFNTNSIKEISKKLFRVQKMSPIGQDSLYLNLRHHLETNAADENPQLRGITWERIQSNEKLKSLTKIKVNHLGEIIKVGE